MAVSPESQVEQAILHLRLESELRDRLEQVAKLNERTLSAEARLAIRHHLEEHERRAA